MEESPVKNIVLILAMVSTIALAIFTVIGIRPLEIRELSQTRLINSRVVQQDEPSFDQLSKRFELDLPSEVIDSQGTDKQSLVTVFIAGDVMLDRYMRVSMNERGLAHPFEKMERIMMGNDISLVNLEGPITTNAPKPLHPNNTTFTFNQDIVPMLKQQGVTMVSLANNHTYDFGRAGYDETINFLEEQEIDYFGDWANKDNLSIVKNIRGVNIGFVGYHQLSQRNKNLVLEEIRLLKNEVDWLIVFPHWGAEYKTYDYIPSQELDGQDFIDAGADFVIGAHPHVVQPIEYYKDGMIFYSLGNFIFDQQFSQDVKTGLALGLSLAQDQAFIRLIVTEHVDYQAILASEEQQDMVLSAISEHPSVNVFQQRMIRSGLIEFKK